MAKKVLIYGGKGGLGTILVSHFISNGWWVCSIDLAKNEEASANVLVNPNETWTNQADQVQSELSKVLGGSDVKVEAILNMAGGFAGGAADNPDFIKNADLMWKQSVWSSTIAASIAARHLSIGGCLVLPGAKAALGGTPGVLGYGLAKAAVHQLVKSLAEPKSGLPADANAFALLPVTLDTPMNRKFMPKADTSTWTNLEFVANLLFKWADGQERPSNGSLVQLITKDGETKLVCE